MHKRTNTSFLAKVIPLGLGLFWATSAAAMQCSQTQGPTNATIGDLSYFALLLDGPIPNNVKNTNTLQIGASASLTGPMATIGAAYGNVIVGALSSVAGDIAASMFNGAPPASTIFLGGNTTVKGIGATDDGGSATPVKSFKGGTSTNGTSPYVTDSVDGIGILGHAVNTEECFDGNVICQPNPTPVVVNVPMAGKQTLTLAYGLNVLSAPNITVGSLGTLTIKGGAHSSVVLETPGQINLGPSSKILLTGGITAASVWITATTPPYNDPGATVSSTSHVVTGAGVTINGTIHGEYGCTFGPNNTINGAAVCDWTLQAGSGLHVNHIASTVSLPSWAGDDYFTCTDPRAAVGEEFGM
ncbi:MAG TPA: hypothetical protein VGG60_15175 [Candidatus Binataceae bacterium]